jgi:hypothetical protein
LGISTKRTLIPIEMHVWIPYDVFEHFCLVLMSFYNRNLIDIIVFVAKLISSKGCTMTIRKQGKNKIY